MAIAKILRRKKREGQTSSFRRASSFSHTRKLRVHMPKRKDSRDPIKQPIQGPRDDDCAATPVNGRAGKSGASTLFLPEDVIWRTLADIDRESSGELRRLARAARLNPRTDFRGVSLAGLSLAKQDVSEFDFSGSDLRGTGIRNARVASRAIISKDTKLDPSRPTMVAAQARGRPPWSTPAAQPKNDRPRGSAGGARQGDPRGGPAHCRAGRGSAWARRRSRSRRPMILASSRASARSGGSSSISSQRRTPTAP